MGWHCFSALGRKATRPLLRCCDCGCSSLERHALAQCGTERATGDRGVAHVASTGFPDFLVNESEVGPAHSHVATCLEVERVWRRCRGAGPVADRARWHNWTNAAERLNAVLHAVSWVDGGTIITCRGTPHRPPPNIVSTVAPTMAPDGCTVDGRRAMGQVVAVRPSGCFTVSIPRHILASIGIKLRTRFHLHVIGEEARLRVTLDEYPYLATREHEWCAMLEPEQEWMVVTPTNTAMWQNLRTCAWVLVLQSLWRSLSEG